MSTPVVVRGPSRSSVARPAAPAPARVIEVDTRHQVPDARAAARARLAAARYANHGTTLLDGAPAYSPVARASRPAPADGWTLVGHWLTLVAVLSVLAVAFAMYGGQFAR